MLVFHELRGIFRIEVPVHLRPNGAVHLECPHAVIVVCRRVVIPAFSAIELENLFQVFFHALVVDGITLFLEEADDENIEEHPVRPYGRTVAVT